jgi:hypothetical protein
MEDLESVQEPKDRDGTVFVRLSGDGVLRRPLRGSGAAARRAKKPLSKSCMTGDTQLRRSLGS